MYDINFFQKVTPFKKKIVEGDFLISDAGEIEKELETFRTIRPQVFNIETTNYCNMKCVMCPRTDLMTRKNIWIDDDSFLNIVDQIKPHSNQDLEKFPKLNDAKYIVVLLHKNTMINIPYKWIYCIETMDEECLNITYANESIFSSLLKK